MASRCCVWDCRLLAGCSSSWLLGFRASDHSDHREEVSYEGSWSILVSGKTTGLGLGASYGVAGVGGSSGNSWGEYRGRGGALAAPSRWLVFVAMKASTVATQGVARNEDPRFYSRDWIDDAIRSALDKIGRAPCGVFWW